MNEEELQDFLHAIKRHNEQMLGAPEQGCISSSAAPLALGGAAVPLVAQSCSRSPSLLRMDGASNTEDDVSRGSLPSRDTEAVTSRPATPDTRPSTPIIAETWSEADGGGPFRGLGAFDYPDESNLTPDELPFVGAFGNGDPELPVLGAEDVQQVLEGLGPLPTDSDEEQDAPVGSFDNPHDAHVLRDGDMLVGSEAVEIVRASGRELAEQFMMRAMVAPDVNNPVGVADARGGRQGRGRARGAGQGPSSSRGSAPVRGSSAVRGAAPARGAASARGTRGQRGGTARGRGEGRGRGEARGRGRARGRGALSSSNMPESSAAEANAALYGGHHLRTTASRRQATGKGGKK